MKGQVTAYFGERFTKIPLLIMCKKAFIQNVPSLSIPSLNILLLKVPFPSLNIPIAKGPNY